MKLVKKTGVFNMFVRGASLIITDEKLWTILSRSGKTVD